MIAPSHVLVLVACFTLASIRCCVADEGFPLNGGFENPGSGEPLGWEANGAWSSIPINSHRGKSHVRVVRWSSRSGMSLVGKGYLGVQPGDSLELSLAYRSSGGQACVGLRFCDEWGRELGQEWTLNLEPAEQWRTAHCTYQVEASEAPQAASVRVFAAIQEAPINFALDDVSLVRSNTRSSSAPEAVLHLRTCGSVSLLPDTGDSVRIGTGPDPEDTDQDATPQSWVSPGCIVDPSYPHRLRAHLEMTGDSPVSATLFLRALGDLPGEVLLQEAAEVGLTAGVTPMDVTLPVLALAPGQTMVEAGVVVDECMPAPVLIRQLEVACLPVTLTAFGVAKKTQFSSPDAVNIFVLALNNMRTTQQTAASMRLLDAEGSVLWSESRYISFGPRSLSSFSVRPTVSGKGDYRFRVRISQGERELADAEYRFSVVADAEEEPVWRRRPFTVQVMGASQRTEFPSPTEVELFISAINNTDEVLRPTAHMEIMDAAGVVVASEDRPIVIGARSTAYFPYRPELTEGGPYRARVLISTGGREHGAGEFEFRVRQPG